MVGIAMNNNECVYNKHSPTTCEQDIPSEGEIFDSDFDDKADNVEQVNLQSRKNEICSKSSRPIEGHVWRQMAEDCAASSLIDQLTVAEVSQAEKTRGIETYNFKAKFNDSRPDPELPELEESDALRRLRKDNVGVWARLGKRRREPEANLEVDIELARIERSKILEQADPEQVRFTKELAERLKESNIVLLAHVVVLLGIEHCRRLLQMTETLEESGGLMTRDGSRRRSAGGVFLQLVKEDKSLSKSQLRSLFQPYQTLMKRKNKKMRILRRAHKALDELEKVFEL
ncbi:phosphorylated adapter RNA export protein-like [Varroa jacobsoni]|uniref:phosphorylated adapter RNA export protein-like n=1 Tax=Varroa jacobsoni TaxID=62625 RepID=UPI000BF587C1|nr:phosphorylated adapter RNA export protein-like [Varroa jacobsoni]